MTVHNNLAKSRGIIPNLSDLTDRLVDAYTSPTEWANATAGQLGKVVNNMQHDYTAFARQKAAYARQLIRAPVLDVIAAEAGHDMNMAASKMERTNVSGW